MKLRFFCQDYLYWLKSPLWYARRRMLILWRWLKFGWSAYDFDYRYAVDAFVLQLEATADFMESGRAYSLESKEHATEVRAAAAELKRVYEDEYALAYHDRLEAKWGKTGFKFVPTGKKYKNPITGKEEDTSTMERTFERDMTPADLEEYEKDHKYMMEEARIEQTHKEAEIWNLIRDRIRHWWD